MKMLFLVLIAIVLCAACDSGDFKTKLVASNAQASATGSSSYLQVAYATNKNRTLTIQFDSNLEPNGPYWDPVLTSSGSADHVITRFQDPSVQSGKTLHVYFNVTEQGSPNNTWYCDFNRNQNQPLDQNAKVTISLFGKTYNDSSVKWAPSSKGGCAGLIDIKP